MLERRSALTTTPGSPGQGAVLTSPVSPRRDAVLSGSRLRMEEVRGWALVQVAAFASTLGELEQAVHPVLGTSLPRQVGVAERNDRYCLFRISAAQFWIITPESHDPLAILHTAVSPEIGAVTSLSHSRVCIAIAGPAARDLLSMGIALDFHPNAFAVGHFASTGLHHTPVLIHRVTEDRFELYAHRTFAQSVWEWLIDAALPFARAQY